MRYCAMPVRTVIEAMTALPDLVAGLFIYAVLIVAFGQSRTGLAASLAIAAAVYCNQLMYRRHFRNPAKVEPTTFPRRDRVLAIVILALWAASITAGRLTAYDDAFVQEQTALGTLIVSVALLVLGYIGVKLYRLLRTALWGPADVETPHHQAVSR